MSNIFENMPKAVVLLSGGLDSATCLAIAKAEGFAPYALSFDYQQRHSSELNAACAVAESIGVAAHQVLAVNLRQWGGSALTSDELDVPENRDVDGSSVPITYVPARNLIFLSLATAYAESQGSQLESVTKTCRWWLRSPGSTLFTASYVKIDGFILQLGTPVSLEKLSVRPAMWVKF